MNDENSFFCPFVSADYIICECGENFVSEDALKIHLEKDSLQHELKLEQRLSEEGFTIINEYKCGTCEEIFDTPEECMKHQDLTHIVTSQDNSECYAIEDATDFLTKVKEENENDGYVDSSIASTTPIEDVKVEMDCDNIKTEPVIPDEELYRFVPRHEFVKQHSRPWVKPKANILKERREKQKNSNKHKNSNAVCEVCGKAYASQVALKYHQRVHTGVRPYPCLYCPKRFTMPLFQQIHIRTHTGEKPYQCAACPKAFGNKAALVRHDRVHTGEKPYECPKCGKAFSQSNSMKLHVHTVHLKMPAPYKSKKRRAKALGWPVYTDRQEQVVLLSNADMSSQGLVEYFVQVADND